MPQLQANGISIECETFGDRRNPSILLIMGLATQMIAWPEMFCDMLVKRGFHVIRFDNRDVGLSQKFDGSPTPGRTVGLLRDLFGLKPRRIAYRLEDMADDAAGVLDALGIDKAHVVGASMGGMIAQIVAARHAPRVLSLTSIMSSSGERSMQKLRLRDFLPLLKLRAPRSDAPMPEHVDYLVKVFHTIGSAGHLVDESERRSLIERSVARSIDTSGMARQSAAIAANGSRRELLQSLRLPTLVLHGKKDILVPALAGFDTVMQVRGARVEFIDDMGHDLPTPLLGRLSDSIAAHCETAAHGKTHHA